jgi:hypothetical protein
MVKSIKASMVARQRRRPTPPKRWWIRRMMESLVKP